MRDARPYRQEKEGDTAVRRYRAQVFVIRDRGP